MKHKENPSGGESFDGYVDKPSEICSENGIIVPDTEKDRYATFGFISWWRQDIVRNARIMVVGAGALGNEILKNLALMGVGYIFIADFDTVENSNLSRSVLFRADDNGRQKAEVAAQRVKEINPDVKVRTFNGDICTDLGLGVYRRMNVIIGGLDNRKARLAVNQACWKVNKPWVDGAIQELYGIARVFVPNQGACYECTLSEADQKILSIRKSCRLLAEQNIQLGRAPTTPTIASIIGGIQTQDALKIIHDMEVQPGTALIFDGLNNDTFLTKYPYKEDCFSHESYGEIIELEAASAATTTVAEMLEISKNYLGNGTILELDHDVVLAFECRICGTEEQVFRSREKLSMRQGLCPDCGKMRNVQMAHVIRGDEPFLDLTLADIGVPPLHIIMAKNASETMYFELTKDVDTLLDFN